MRASLRIDVLPRLAGDNVPHGALAHAEHRRQCLEGHAGGLSQLADRPHTGRIQFRAVCQGTSACAGLHHRRGPSAVTGFVVAVVVDAIKGMARRRLRSHVREESRETLGPPGTDRDATPPVPAPGAGLRVAASAQHVPPTPILGALAGGVRRVAVRGVCRSHVRTTKTPARLAATRTKTTATYPFDRAAITDTPPIGLTVSARGGSTCGDGEAAVPSAGHVDDRGCHRSPNLVGVAWCNLTRTLVGRAPRIG